MPADFVENKLAKIILPRLITVELLRSWSLQRPPDGHKGSFGRAALVGGSAGMAGAMALAGEAVGRMGTGLTYLYVAADIRADLLQVLPDALISPLPQSFQGQDAAMLAGKQAYGIGPGAGRGLWLDAALTYLIEQAPALVIDADALNALSRQRIQWQQILLTRTGKPGLQPAILTPHPGEFIRLAPDLADILQHDRQTAAIQLAARTGCVVILKGAATVVAEPQGRSWINPTGHEGMGKGGSGDILTGMLTGLLAQGMPAIPAAISAVYLHGLAADLAAEDWGQRALLPHDLLRFIPQALNLIYRTTP